MPPYHFQYQNFAAIRCNFLYKTDNTKVNIYTLFSYTIILQLYTTF